jgi:3-oxoacyl-[acyl-carrier-protein] synthase-3
VLFGDGAGAVMLTADGKQPRPATYLQCGGDPTVIEAEHAGKFTMRGHDVYAFAVNALFTSVTHVLKEQKKTLKDVGLIIPHQSNANILKDACTVLKIEKRKMFMNLQRYGNTAAASVAIALHEAIAKKRVRRGEWICLCAYGAGPAWGSVLLKY